MEECKRTDLAAEVSAAYDHLGDDTAVAVRSSARAKDTSGTSFVGMHETFVNVVGHDALFAHLMDCWASLFRERVIGYRASQGLTDESAIAVVVSSASQ